MQIYLSNSGQEPIYAHTREECEEKLKTLITQMKAELAELKRQKADNP